MNIITQTKQMLTFTDMKEMKRWQAEREDQFNAEMIRTKLEARHALEQDGKKLKNPK